ncbi:SPRE reductase, partial [Atractosteus spatula]|nr:SPRE reductase [Atractosteus spatula]
MPGSDLGKAVCIITGASKGFGRGLALQLGGLLQAGSVLVLAARSGDRLLELRGELSGELAGVQVRCVTADLARREGTEETVRVAREAAPKDIDHLLLINNAGSLGDISRNAVSFTDPSEVDAYLSMNVSSALSLTASVLGAFPRRPGLRRSVVNISSLCALQPYRSWVLYCTGKAARNMMFRVLAEEEPDVRVLNYAPGPLDTDMQTQARSLTGDAQVRQSLSDMHSRGELISCSQSGAKLAQLLLEDQYQSGAHIDYYDI